MQLNKLPEGFEGRQKRRTGFESEEGKLVYDARRLVEMARARNIFTVSGTLELAERGDDNVEGLRKAIRHEIKDSFEFTEEQKALLTILKTRFDTQTNFHKGIRWLDVEYSLRDNTEAFAALAYMESTGGEPAVLKLEGNELVFTDTSEESPSGRRDRTHQEAVDEARNNGLELASEDDYMCLQRLKVVDINSRSWLGKPSQNREDFGHDMALRGGSTEKESGGVVKVQARVAPFSKSDNNDEVGFRCSLRVKKS